jgi:hypothetical protein
MSPSPVPLERYICNFLLEVPSPVPGKVDIQYSMLDQVSPPILARVRCEYSNRVLMYVRSGVVLAWCR